MLLVGYIPSLTGGGSRRHPGGMSYGQNNCAKTPPSIMLFADQAERGRFGSSESLMADDRVRYS
jgi:hypothetical protein